MTYTDKLDFAGRAVRQRKTRTMYRDFREHDEATAVLLRGDGYDVEQATLLVGDWAWDLEAKSWLNVQYGYTRFVAERKTLADLRDVDRLKDQLFRARDLISREPPTSKMFFIVLIEYKFDTDVKRKWADKAIRSAKLSIQFGGVRVTECQENGIAEALDGLFVWSQKPRHQVAA